ncbi:Hsp70 family protein [Nostoc sp.]|uniref:Hsp70 family protein n=1 Tax=Nostoc sp. TaxID=1180 RepID=UPI002FF0AAE9
MNQENITIIGFDLGHGEVSLAKINSISSPPEVLLLHGKKSQPTAVACIGDKKVFGEVAMRRGTQDFEIAFKKRPTSDLKYKQNIQDLVSAIYLHLIDTYQVDESNCNHFFIGCPSGWSESDRKNYEDIFISLGIKTVTVVSESRAALMQAIQSDKFTRKELLGSILIIDIGSSTTDLTLVENMKDKPIDFGDDIGASLIDKAILEYSIAHSKDSEQLQNILEKHQHYKNKCEFLCRKAKEEYFCYEMNYEEPEFYVCAGLPEKLTKDLSFDPLLNKNIMDQLLGERWINTFTDFLCEAKQELESNLIKPSAILLTGGASKMGFISKIVKEVFDYSSLKRDSEPETCVAKGLAQWGKIYYKTEHFKKDCDLFLDTELEKIIEDEKSVLALIDDLSEFITNGILNQVTKLKIIDWRNQNIETLNELELQIEKSIKNWLTSSETNTQVIKVIMKWLDKNIITKLKAETDKICQTYGIPESELQLPKIDNFTEVKQLEYDINIDLLNFTKQLLGLLYGIVNGILGGFLAIIFFGTGGLALTVAALFGISLIGENREKAIQKINDLNIPKMFRQVVTDKAIDQKISRQKNAVINDIKNSLITNKKETVDKITQLMKEQIKTIIKEKIDRARLLIY